MCSTVLVSLTPYGPLLSITIPVKSASCWRTLKLKRKAFYFFLRLFTWSLSPYCPYSPILFEDEWLKAQSYLKSAFAKNGSTKFHICYIPTTSRSNFLSFLTERSFLSMNLFHELSWSLETKLRCFFHEQYHPKTFRLDKCFLWVQLGKTKHCFQILPSFTSPHVASGLQWGWKGAS